MTGAVSTNHFDARAATWDDDPAKVERAKVVADKIWAAVPLDRSARMLEYGAGTGRVTQALRDFVGPVTLADTSAGMREVMRAKIEADAITDARVWDVDLATQPAPSTATTSRAIGGSNVRTSRLTWPPPASRTRCSPTVITSSVTASTIRSSLPPAVALARVAPGA